MTNRPSERWVYVAGAAFQRAVPFILLPIFVRFLSPDEYGQVSVLTAVFTLVSMTSGLGQEVVEYRYFFDKSTRGRSIMRAAVGIHLAGPVTIGLAAAAVMVGLEVEFAGVPALPLAGAILGGAIYVTAWRFPAVLFRCEGDLGRFFALSIGYAVLSSVVRVVLLIPLGLPVGAWILGDVIAALLLLLVTRRIYVTQLRSLNTEVGREHRRAALSLGVPAMTSQGARWVAGYSDRLLLVGLMGAAAGGTYMVATQLVSVSALLIMELSVYLQPVIAATETVAEAIEQTLKRHAVAVIAVAILGALGSASLVAVGFVGDYAGVASVAILLSGSVIFQGHSYLAGDLCSISLGATKYVAGVSVVTGVSAVGLSLILIPTFGMYGAAGAAVLTQAISAALLWGRLLIPAPERLRRVVVWVILVPSAVAATLTLFAWIASGGE